MYVRRGGIEDVCFVCQCRNGAPSLMEIVDPYGAGPDAFDVLLKHAQDVLHVKWRSL